MRLSALAVVLFLSTSCREGDDRVPAVGKHGCVPPRAPVKGGIERDTRWCGTVRVGGNVLVPKGVTLIVEPGTIVRFRPYRGYREPEKRLQLRVEGRLVARGRPGQLIRFTSDTVDPRNGDWSMVKLVSARGSRVAYALFEFGQHGLNIWNTDIDLSRVVIRFQNWEGLYAENNCRVTVDHSRIYANGYNCIAVEQKVRLEVRNSYIANCGTLGIHVDSSTAVIERNLIEGSQEGLCLDNDSTVTAVANRFAAPLNAAISCDQGKNRLTMANNVWDGVAEQRAVHCPDEARREVQSKKQAPLDAVVGVKEEGGAYIDYIPGDRRDDKYPYVYPERDETREVTRKIGGGIGLTWSLAWDGAALWTGNLAGELFRLDPRSGKVLRRLKAPGPQPWGMTHDGRLLWINDFARRRIYSVNPETGKVERQFPAPDPKGGCKGLTFDGTHLYALGWATHRIYRLSLDGKLLGSVAAPHRDLGGGLRRYVAGGLAWDGKAFWGPADRLFRFDRSGAVLGWIHSTSERVWDLAWDGEQLWTTQRANENWDRFPRIFRVRPLKPQVSDAH
jgi:hypothetical protein